jgi:hypothetical protein
MIEGVRGETQDQPMVLICFLCLRPHAASFVLAGAEIPCRSGMVSGIAVCATCMHAMTRSRLLEEWSGEEHHGVSRNS